MARFQRAYSQNALTLKQSCNCPARGVSKNVGHVRSVAKLARPNLRLPMMNKGLTDSGRVGVAIPLSGCNCSHRSSGSAKFGSRGTGGSVARRFASSVQMEQTTIFTVSSLHRMPTESSTDDRARAMHFFLEALSGQQPLRSESGRSGSQVGRIRCTGPSNRLGNLLRDRLHSWPEM